MRNKIRAALIAFAVVALGLGFASPAEAATTYYYVAGQQFLPAGVTTGGVSANLPITQTYVNTSELGHSLFEIDVEKGTGVNRQLVEFGVDHGALEFGDTKPRLFAGIWVNGVFQGCYAEGCGYIDFTPADSTDDLGIDLSSYASLTWPNYNKQFQIIYGGTCSPSGASGWWLRFNGNYLGCFPDTIWSSAGASFTSGTAIQAWGEVVTQGTNRPCSDMAGGKAGSSVVAPLDASDPDYIGTVSLLNPVPAGTATSLNLVQTDSSIYSYGTVGSTGNRTFAVGGAGANSTNGTPGIIGNC